MKLQTVLSLIAAVLSLASAMSAQTTQYRNELNGYEFFGSGRLKGLHLLSSTTDDVKHVFGAGCEKQCDLDADWTVNFEYFEEAWTREESNNRGDKRVYKLDPRYVGKLRQMLGDRIVWVPASFVVEDHHGRAGDRLGHGEDAKDRIFSERLARLLIVDSHRANARNLAVACNEREGARKPAGIDVRLNRGVDRIQARDREADGLGRCTFHRSPI